MAEFQEGFCHIRQGDTHLTEFDGKAVTAMGGEGKHSWHITSHPDMPGSRHITIAMTTGLLGGSHGETKVLTVGGKVEHENGIQIYLEDLKHPPAKSQLWTLEHVIATKRHPPLILAHIQSVEYPDMSAGVGILDIPLPKLYRNVAAVPNGKVMEDEKWTLDYFLP